MFICCQSGCTIFCITIS